MKLRCTHSERDEREGYCFKKTLIMSTMKYEKEEYDDDEVSDHSGSITSDGEFEDEQRGGDHEEGADEQQVKRVKKNSKFDLPTKEEQMHLRETQNLMTANLLHLQVSEMINEVHDHKDGKLTNKRRRILAWLDELKVNMKKISVKGGEVSNSWLKKYNIPHIKLENYTNETVLQFHPPSSVEVVGSFSLNTATKPYTNIDVVVTIPAECFDPRDILNHVYFDKRKLYLATIIRQLMSPCLKFKDTIDISSIKVAFFKGDTRKPIVCFKPNFKCPYVVRVIPVVRSVNIEYFVSAVCLLTILSSLIFCYTGIGTCECLQTYSVTPPKE